MARWRERWGWGEFREFSETVVFSCAIAGLRIGAGPGSIDADLDASSIADADAFQLEGLEEDLAEEAAMAAEELGIAADEAYLEELETRAAAIRGIASAREWIASAHDAAEALAATAASKAEAAEAAAGMDDAAAKADAEEAQLAAEEGRLAEMEATEAAEAAIAGAQARVLAAERRTADARRAAAEAAAAVEEAWIRSGRVVPGAEREDKPSFEELDEEAAIAAEEEAIAADEAYLDEFATTARRREDPSPKPPTTAPSRSVGLHAALGLTLGLICAAALWALQDAGFLPS